MFDLEEDPEKIQNFFAQKEEVILAYLYGSYATGRVWAESDLDIAVLFDSRFSPLEQFQLTLRYMAEIDELIGGGVEIDVRELNPAPLEFRIQVIKPGRCLYARSERERVDFETRTIIEYLDFKPALDEYYHHLIKRIKEGRYSARLAKYKAEVRALAGRPGKAGKPSPAHP
ncbi:MAG: type VII toxin-antitoxin system MntA family adenylyltransferase antitoxin [Anaerolineae bacterium]